MTTAHLVHEYLELTLFFIQLQPTILDSNYSFFITPIWSYTGLTGLLAKGNKEINKILIENIL